MKRFQFRLQAALDLRRRREETLQGELAQSRVRERHEAERLERLHAAFDHAAHEAALARQGHFHPEETQAAVRYLESLEEMIATQKDLLRLVQDETRRKRAEVITATQERKALDNLREQHLRDYHRQELREEQNFLDEIATLRAARLEPGLA